MEHKEITEQQRIDSKKLLEFYGNKKAVDAAAKKVSILDFVSTDENRMFMNGIFYEKGFAIATNGQVLIKQKQSYPAEYEGKIIDPNTGNEIEGQFPNYKKVFPPKEVLVDRSVRLAHISGYLSNATAAVALTRKNKNGSKNFVPVMFENTLVNSEYLQTALIYARDMGFNKVYQSDNYELKTVLDENGKEVKKFYNHEEKSDDPRFLYKYYTYDELPDEVKKEMSKDDVSWNMATVNGVTWYQGDVTESVKVEDPNVLLNRAIQFDSPDGSSILIMPLNSIEDRTYLDKDGVLHNYENNSFVQTKLLGKGDDFYKNIVKTLIKDSSYNNADVDSLFAENLKIAESKMNSAIFPRDKKECFIYATTLTYADSIEKNLDKNNLIFDKGQGKATFEQFVFELELNRISDFIKKPETLFYLYDENNALSPQNIIKYAKERSIVAEKKQSPLFEEIEQKELPEEQSEAEVEEQAPETSQSVSNEVESTTGPTVQKEVEKENALQKEDKNPLPFSIIDNKEKGRVNIKFDTSHENPQFAEIVRELKSNGWKYAPSNKQWYPVGKAVEKASDFAQKLQEKYSGERVAENKETSVYDGIRFFDRNYNEPEELMAYLNGYLTPYISLAETSVILEALEHDNVGLLSNRDERLGLNDENKLVVFSRNEGKVEIKELEGVKHLFNYAQVKAEIDLQKFKEMQENMEKKNPEVVNFMNAIYETTISHRESVVRQMTSINESYFPDKAYSYDQIRAGLSEEEIKSIYSETSYNSQKSIIPIDFIRDWMEAEKLEDVHERNLIMFKVYSAFEEHNLHEENKLLLNRNYSRLEQMYGQYQTKEPVSSEKMIHLSSEKSEDAEFLENYAHQKDGAVLSEYIDFKDGTSARKPAELLLGAAEKLGYEIGTDSEHKQLYIYDEQDDEKPYAEYDIKSLFELAKNDLILSKNELDVLNEAEKIYDRSYQFAKEKIPYVEVPFSENSKFKEECGSVMALSDFNEKLIETEKIMDENKAFFSDGISKYDDAGAYGKYADAREKGTLTSEQEYGFGLDKTDVAIHLFDGTDEMMTYSITVDLGSIHSSIYDYVKETCSHPEVLTAMNATEDRLCHNSVTDEEKKVVAGIRNEVAGMLDSNQKVISAQIKELMDKQKPLRSAWIASLSDVKKADKELDDMQLEMSRIYLSCAASFEDKVLEAFSPKSEIDGTPLGFNLQDENPGLQAYVKKEIKNMIIEQTHKYSRRGWLESPDKPFDYELWRTENKYVPYKTAELEDFIQSAMPVPAAEMKKRTQINKVEEQKPAELSQFDKELLDYKNGSLPENHIFNLGLPCEILQKCGFSKDNRIEMSASRLLFKSKLTRHPFDLADIVGIDRALQNPVAVFEYGDRTKSQNVIVNIQKDGKNFLAGIHFNQQKHGFEVSDIRTLYPKDNVEWLNWINQGKMIYGDKEKLQALTAQQRMNYAEVNNQVAQSPLYEHCLESANTILDKFVNVNQIFTDGNSFYDEIKERSKIEQKFYTFYVTKGNLDARELSVEESEEFYNALKNNDESIIKEYTETDIHEIQELAKEILEERNTNISMKKAEEKNQKPESHDVADEIMRIEHNKEVWRENHKSVNEGDVLGEDTVTDVYKISDGVFEAVLSQDMKGVGSATNYLVINKSVASKCNKKIIALAEENENLFVFKNKASEAYIRKELIDRNLCPLPENKDDYYQKLSEYVEKHPLKYASLAPNDSFNFENNLKKMIALEPEQKDILALGKKLISMASPDEQKRIGQKILDSGGKDEASMKKLFEKWSSSSIEQEKSKKKDGYPPRGEN